MPNANHDIYGPKNIIDAENDVLTDTVNLLKKKMKDQKLI